MQHTQTQTPGRFFRDYFLSRPNADNQAALEAFRAATGREITKAVKKELYTTKSKLKAAAQMPQEMPSAMPATNGHENHQQPDEDELLSQFETSLDDLARSARALRDLNPHYGDVYRRVRAVQGALYHPEELAV
jgi:hypothetical protein